MKRSTQAVIDLHARLQCCRRCPEMVPPVVVGEPILSRVMSIGQAPGDKEGASTWHRTEPGISLLGQALALIAKHPAWKQIFE